MGLETRPPAVHVIAVGRSLELAGGRWGERRLRVGEEHRGYDTVSLLKEYKREVMRFVRGERDDYPPFPENYFNLQVQALLEEYRDRAVRAREGSEPLSEFPEDIVAPQLHNTWRDTAEAMRNNAPYGHRKRQ